MMDISTFRTIIKKLEDICTPLNERQASIYFEHLGKFPESHLRTAIHTLIETHVWKRFPMIREIRDILDRVQVKSVSHAEADDLDYYDRFPCQLCNNTGFVLTEIAADKDYPFSRAKADFCACRHGVKRKGGWVKHFEREKIKSIRKAERIYEPDEDGVPF